MDALDKLKDKTIDEFEALLKLLEVGHQPDTTDILNKITCINDYEKFDNINAIIECLLYE